MQQINLGDITIEVVQKDIKNLHLSVYPPFGRVKISAPLRMDLETIRIFAITKLAWIKNQRTKLKKQEREAPREYLTQESHYYLGKRYLLKVIETDSAHGITLKHSKIIMHVRKDTDVAQKKSVLEEWYRAKLKALLPALINKWEHLLNVKLNEFGIRKMRTKWGTCNPDARRIWLNLELAKKPLPCIEYIVVHEMVHLIERKHDDKFVDLMNKHLPQWRYLKEELNRLPVSHIDWKY